MTLLLRQTASLLWDSGRELRSAKVFWIALGLMLMALVAAAGVSVGGDRVGWFWMSTRAEGLGAIIDAIGVGRLYRFVFAEWIVPNIVNWAITVLAIFATAGIAPAMLTGGGLDLILSRPIGRVRLLLTRFLGGLLFTASLAAAFSLGSILILGFRAGSWSLDLLWAIPILTLVYAYLFSVCVLMGVLTKSALAALLTTFMVWIAAVVIGGLEPTGLRLHETANIRLEQAEARLADLERQRDEADGDDRSRLADQVERYRPYVDDAQDAADETRIVARLATAARWTLPQTGPTLGLLGELIVRDEDRRLVGPEQTQEDVRRQSMSREEFQADGRVRERLDARSPAAAIGGSLAFTAAMLGLASFVFARRDF